MNARHGAFAWSMIGIPSSATTSTARPTVCAEDRVVANTLTG